MKKLFKNAVCLLLVGFLMLPAIPTAKAARIVSRDDFICRSGLATTERSDTYLEAYDRIAQCIEGRRDEVYVDDLDLTISELDLVHNALRNDPNGYFWLDTVYNYGYSTSTGKATRYIPVYNSLAGDSLKDLKQSRKVFNAAALELIENAGVTEAMSDYMTELLLHDALIVQNTYEEATNAHNEYGAIVDGKTVCQGYSLAFQYLLRLCGINACSVTGYAGEPHSWNLVFIDGEYYYTDVTWDDVVITPRNNRSDIFYAYFNVTEDVLRLDHTWNEPEYGLPSCTSTRRNYYSMTPGHGVSSSSITVESAVSLFKNCFARLYVTDYNVQAVIDWFYENAVDIALDCGFDLTKPATASYEYARNELHIFIDGTITPPEFILGDVNCDKVLNALDTNLAARIMTNTVVPTIAQKTAADVYKDDTINPIDINLIIRIIADY